MHNVIIVSMCTHIISCFQPCELCASQVHACTRAEATLYIAQINTYTVNCSPHSPMHPTQEYAIHKINTRNVQLIEVVHLRHKTSHKHSNRCSYWSGTPTLIAVDTYGYGFRYARTTTKPQRSATGRSCCTCVPIVSRESVNSGLDYWTGLLDCTEHSQKLCIFIYSSLGPHHADVHALTCIQCTCNVHCTCTCTCTCTCDVFCIPVHRTVYRV